MTLGPDPLDGVRDPTARRQVMADVTLIVTAGLMAQASLEERLTLAFQATRSFEYLVSHEDRFEAAVTCVLVCGATPFERNKVVAELQRVIAEEVTPPVLDNCVGSWLIDLWRAER